MKIGKMNKRGVLPLAGIACFMAAVAVADVTVPDWLGDEGVISVVYAFETNATNPPPSASANLVGAPDMVIDKFTEASAGWISTNVFGAEQILRGNGGAWELGEQGSIQLALPVRAAGEPLTLVEFYVEVIASQGITVLPVIEVDGTTGLFQMTEVIEADPLGLYDWMRLASTGSVELAGSTDLNVDVTCYDTTTFGDSSSIDQVAVYARVIPEPGVLTLMALFAGSMIAVRRIFSVGT